MPAILVELAYLSNLGDARKLREDPESFAQGIYQGLLSYFGFSPRWRNKKKRRETRLFLFLCLGNRASQWFWMACWMREGISLFSLPRAKASSSWSLSRASLQ